MSDEVGTGAFRPYRPTGNDSETPEIKRSRQTEEAGGASEAIGQMDPTQAVLLGRLLREYEQGTSMPFSSQIFNTVPPLSYPFPPMSYPTTVATHDLLNSLGMGGFPMAQLPGASGAPGAPGTAASSSRQSGSTDSEDEIPTVLKHFLTEPWLYLVDPEFERKLTALLEAQSKRFHGGFESATSRVSRGGTEDSSDQGSSSGLNDSSGSERLVSGYPNGEFDHFVIGLKYKSDLAEGDYQTKRFRPHEATFLKQVFNKFAYPNRQNCEKLAGLLGRDGSQVQKWFKLRRRTRSTNLKNILSYVRGGAQH